MAFSENLDDFLDEEQGFADYATYTKSGETPKEILGVYDNEYQEIGIGEAGFSGVVISFTAKTSELPNADYDDTLEYKGTTYKIVEVEKEYDGLSNLILNET